MIEPKIRLELELFEEEIHAIHLRIPTHSISRAHDIHPYKLVQENILLLQQKVRLDLL